MIMLTPKDIRAGMKAGFSKIEQRFTKVDHRFDRIEGRRISFNKLQTAGTMMLKFVTGDLEEPIGTLENKVDDVLKRS